MMQFLLLVVFLQLFFSLTGAFTSPRIAATKSFQGLSTLKRDDIALSLQQSSNERCMYRSLDMKSDALKIIIAGAPASGKGTQCEKIVNEYGVVHLSTGDILRAAVKDETPLGVKAKGFMDAGALVPDELIIDVVSERLQQQDCIDKGWLLDGFPRTKSQADALSNNGQVPDVFLLLDVPENVLVERVVGRRTDPITGKIYHMKFSPPPYLPAVRNRLIHRSDDTAEKIVTRYQEFQTHIDSIKSSYASITSIVDGTKSSSEVTDAVMNSLDSVSGSGSGTKSSSSSGSGGVKLAPLLGVVALLVIDKAGKSLFNRLNIVFPSSLGVMVASFLSLLLLDRTLPSLSSSISSSLAPAVALLKVWMPLFFVPPLVVLPLKYALISDKIFKLISLTTVGLVVSLLGAGK